LTTDRLTGVSRYFFISFGIWQKTTD